MLAGAAVQMAELEQQLNWRKEFIQEKRHAKLWLILIMNFVDQIVKIS